MTSELEHRDVTRGDPLLSAKIALAHLRERPDYYDLLAKLERSPRTRANPDDTEEYDLGLSREGDLVQYNTGPTMRDIDAIRYKPGFPIHFIRIRGSSLHKTEVVVGEKGELTVWSRNKLLVGKGAITTARSVMSTWERLMPLINRDPNALRTMGIPMYVRINEVFLGKYIARNNPNSRHSQSTEALKLLMQHGVRVPMAIYIDAESDRRALARLEAQVSRAYIDQYRSRDTAEFLFVFSPRKHSVENHPLPGERADLYEQVAREIRRDARYEGYRYLGDDLYGLVEHRLRLGA